MANKDRIVIFNSEYERLAKNCATPAECDEEKKRQEEKMKICYSCRQPFKDDDIVFISYIHDKPQRRHATCAYEKKCIDEDEAMSLLDRAVDDMDVSIKQAFKKTLAYQLLTARRKEKERERLLLRATPASRTVPSRTP